MALGQCLSEDWAPQSQLLYHLGEGLDHNKVLRASFEQLSQLDQQSLDSLWLQLVVHLHQSKHWPLVVANVDGLLLGNCLDQRGDVSLAELTVV